MKSAWKIIRTTFIVLLCIEIFLHFYNPFLEKENDVTVTIPVNSKYELKDLNIKGLDKEFTHSKNSIGFRGSELPKDNNVKKIICMGGSATECFYLSDGKDWPSYLENNFKQNIPEIWMNNAGQSGKNIDDNLALLKKHILKLKPTIIFLMSGLDDIGNAPKKITIIEKSRIRDLYNFLALPKVFNYLFIKNTDSKKQPFTLLDLSNPEKLEMSDSLILQRIAKEQPLIEQYKKTLQDFADICKQNNIKLVLVSQVILFGDETDLISDVNLSDIRIGDINGRTEALLLKQYNKSTYEIADANHLTFINLSARLPKDSRFFYDGFHFTKDGSEMVANIIFDESKDLLKK